MSVELDNVRILKDAYERWAACKAADFSCWTDIAAEDLSFRSLAEGASQMLFTKARNGREQFLGYLQGLVADWEMVSYSIDEFVAQGERVVAIGTATNWG